MLLLPDKDFSYPKPKVKVENGKSKSPSNFDSFACLIPIPFIPDLKNILFPPINLWEYSVPMFKDSLLLFGWRTSKDTMSCWSSFFNGFIDEQLKNYELSDDNLALVGFSQGTMMSLHVGLRRENSMRAIVGFSGRLIAPELLKNELKSKPPIYLIHGDMDPMVPYQETIEAEKKLSQLSIDVKAHISTNTQHSIAQDGLDIAIKFLVEKFSN